MYKEVHIRQRFTVKGKVVPVLNYYAMKAYKGEDVETHIFLTSALVGGEWTALPPVHIGQEVGRTPGPVWTT
jgi:hypothetical protein